jgi:hypothetical protein
MKSFYIISIFLIFIILLNLILFLNRRFKLKDNTIAIIRLKGPTWSDYVFLILSGFILFYITYNKYKDICQYYHFAVFILLVIFAMISRLIQAGENITINTNGIRDFKLIKWDSITQIKRDEHNIYEIIILTNNKNKRIDFYSDDKIDEFKLKVKKYSPKIYELYLAGL